MALHLVIERLNHRRKFSSQNHLVHLVQNPLAACLVLTLLKNLLPQMSAAWSSAPHQCCTILRRPREQN